MVLNYVRKKAGIIIITKNIYHLNTLLHEKRTHTCIFQNIQMSLEVSNNICRKQDFSVQLSTSRNTDV